MENTGYEACVDKLSLYLCLSDSDVLSEEPQVCNDALHVSFDIGESSFHIRNIFLCLLN